MAFIFEPAIQPATDVNGDRISGAYWRFCLAGTTTATSVYSDEALSTPLTNPVVADSAGEFVQIYLDPDVSYRATLYDANDVQLTDVDDYDITVPSTVALLATLAGTGGAALIGTSTGETVEERLGRTAFGIGLFTSFTGTPPEIDSAVKTVYTDGYGAAGIGIARYIYDANVDSSYVTDFPLSSFLADDGRGFRIDPKQELHIEMFGGRADCPISTTSPYATSYTTSGSAPTGTDNLDAINEAMLIGEGSSAAAQAYVQPIHFYGGEGQNGYYFSDTIVPPRQVYLKGLASGIQNETGTVFKFPADTGGIRFYMGQNNPKGVFHTSGSTLEGIYFYGNGGTDRSGHGLWMHTRVVVRNCVFDSFPGDNIHNVAGVGYATSDDKFGLTSSSHIEKVGCKYAGNWNIYTADSDTSASTFVNVQCRLSRLGGIYEGSAFGNTYIGCEIDDYGNGRVGAVHHGGRLYVLIDNTAGIGASTTPGTNNEIWYDMGAGSVSATWPAWSASNTYELSIPVYCTGASNRSVFVGTYVENFYPSHTESACPAIFLGGNIDSTRYSRYVTGFANRAGEAIVSHTGYGGYKSYSPDHSTLGSYFTASVGNGDGVILNHRQESDGELDWKLQYYDEDIYYSFGGIGGGFKTIYKITGPNTTEDFGSGTAQGHWPAFYGIAIGSTSAVDEAVRIVSGTAAPASGAWSQGDICFNTSAAAGGTIGWVCTTAGSPGTWKTFGTIAA